MSHAVNWERSVELRALEGEEWGHVPGIAPRPVWLQQSEREFRSKVIGSGVRMTR